MKELDKLNKAGLTVLAMRQDVSVLFRLKPTILQRQSLLEIREHLTKLSLIYTARITKLMEANREALEKARRTRTRS